MAKIEKFFHNYSKSEGFSDLRKTRSAEVTSEYTSDLIYEIHSLPGNYQKKEGTLSSVLIIVVSGGEVRERNYLSELTKKHTFPRVKLIFESSEKKKGGLSPKMMISKLEEIVERNETIKSHKIFFSTIDRIFMVTDVDHYYPELVEVLPQNTDSKLTWIISNPCFEIWLYYAHKSAITPDVRILETLPQSRQSSKLKQINGEIVKGGIDPRKAFEKIRSAIENSKINYAEDEHNIPILYATNMFVLGEYLLDAIGKNEFEIWLQSKQKQIQEFRKGL